MKPTTTRFQGFEGLSLTADIYGEADAWPVLLMHGGGQTRHAWGKTAENLAQAGWRAISMDLRGYGDSSWAENGDYSFSTYAADCIAVCDQLHKPPVLVGASLGGVSAIVAEGHSDRVVSSALVVVDITHQSNPEGIERITQFMMSGMGGFASLEEAAVAIAAYTPQRKRKTNPAGLQKVLRLRSDGRWYWHWDPRFLARGRTEVPAPNHQISFEAALAGIHVPTLLVRGLLSDVVTEDGVTDFLKKIPHAKLANVEDAAHMVAGDQNDHFSQSVIEFLEADVKPQLPR
ncbi:MAG: alpha/beta hydrolase [Deltaproteobacteria bacterium]|jgi:pimeloyl-ACP methyl ester carboxylesterase|nr:alpha/beta hydrolase [Deltaproteobacteria bacterium]